MFFLNVTSDFPDSLAPRGREKRAYRNIEVEVLEMKRKELEDATMGEGYGIYKVCDDEEMMKHITIANVACGYHAADPVVMNRTVELAKAHNVKVGAHPSYPDRQGFGRREMKIDRDEHSGRT